MFYRGMKKSSKVASSSIRQKTHKATNTLGAHLVF